MSGGRLLAFLMDWHAIRVVPEDRASWDFHHSQIKIVQSLQTVFHHIVSTSVAQDVLYFRSHGVELRIFQLRRVVSATDSWNIRAESCKSSVR